MVKEGRELTAFKYGCFGFFCFVLFLFFFLFTLKDLFLVLFFCKKQYSLTVTLLGITNYQIENM